MLKSHLTPVLKIKVTGNKKTKPSTSNSQLKKKLLQSQKISQHLQNSKDGS